MVPCWSDARSVVSLCGISRKHQSPRIEITHRRLDSRLVELKLARSREQAHDLVSSNKVLVNGSVALKASRQVTTSDDIHVTSPANEGFVSRGGVKLDFALNVFGINPSSLRCLDAGASTGGFTDCLLKRGAKEVVAVDVGHGQLHEKLLGNSRVSVMDNTNVRYLELPGSHLFDLAVCDLSFISLRTLVPVFTGSMLKLDSCLVLLVKPQFEAGRKIVSQGKGIVKDTLVHKSVLVGVSSDYLDAGCSIEGITPSPIKGAKGNIEYFIHMHNGIGSNGCFRSSVYTHAAIPQSYQEHRSEKAHTPARTKVPESLNADKYEQDYNLSNNLEHMVEEAVEEVCKKWLV